MERRAHARTAQLPLTMHPRMIGHQLVFAAFLLVTGAKMLLQRDTHLDPARSRGGTPPGRVAW